MGPLVTYRLHDAVATITMDDGKVNVLSLAMLTELDAALDQAAADRAVVVLTGRDVVFSAGFDLPVLRAGGTEAADLLHARRTGRSKPAENTPSRPVSTTTARSAAA